MTKKTLQSVPLYNRFEKEMDLFTRHIRILTLVYQKSPIGILRLSRETKLPKHKVRYSLKILENEGLIEAKTVGAVAVNSSEEFLQNIHALITRFKEEFDEMGKTTQQELEALKKR